MMTIDKEKARKQLEEDIKNVDKDDVEYASKKGYTKIEELENNQPSALKQMWEDIKTMVSLVKDYVSGDYKEVPWNVIASITAAVIYFASPIDLIPDFIPIAGYIDDALILKLALEFASDDLEKYKEWKEG